MEIKEAKLKAYLIDHTSNPAKIICKAAKSTKYEYSLENLLEKSMTEAEKEKILTLLYNGHLSPFEHAIYTVGIEGVSRVLTHQLVRHRIASYSQQSQRETNTYEYVIPDSIKEKTLEREYCTKIKEIFDFYQNLINQGIPLEDARYILPNAAETKIIMTANVREWFHFLNLRGCYRTQWEIRNLAEKIYALFYPTEPRLWDLAGPSCVSKGKCDQGRFSCGKVKKRRKEWENLKS
ncbi:MAG: FAD-dependent thymidylate synthase [Candidatus Nanoarchaeia archaeon]